MPQCTCTWRPQVFSLCQIYVKVPKISEIKWNGSFRFLLTGIFGITSECGSLISVRLVLPKFDILLLTNGFIIAVTSSLMLGIWKLIKNGKSMIPLGWPGYIGKCMSFYFSWAFALVSYRSVGIIEAPACNEYHTKDFLVAISWGSQKEAHGSQCEVQVSQNSPSLRL